MGNFSFIHMADPQFGLFADSSGKSPEEIASFAARGLMVRPAAKFDGLGPETELFTKAIAAANTLAPKFVVVCGDIVNSAGDHDQIETARQIADELDAGIDLHWVAGNHDLATDHRTPSRRLLDRYRENFGSDYYDFFENGVAFIVINSTVLDAPNAIPGEADAQMDFIERALDRARLSGSDQIALFSHHPPFLDNPNEPDSPASISMQYRRPLLDLFTQFEVSVVFAGHRHRNSIATSNGLKVVASGPVGYPLGDDPSGYRVVDIRDGKFVHEYFPLAPAPDNRWIERIVSELT